MIALGRLGWSLRRIEQATGVRRETASGYLRSAGVALRAPGGWGRKPPKPATSVITGSADSKPAIEVTTGSGGPKPKEHSKPANEVITGFLPPAIEPETIASARQVPVKCIARRSCGSCRGAATRWASGRIWWTGTGSLAAIRASSVSCARCAEPPRRKRGRSSRRDSVRSARLITAPGRWCAIQTPASTGARGCLF